jgi:hypothetical protein
VRPHEKARIMRLAYGPDDDDPVWAEREVVPEHHELHYLPTIAVMEKYISFGDDVVQKMLTETNFGETVGDWHSHEQARGVANWLIDKGHQVTVGTEEVFGAGPHLGDPYAGEG